MLWERFTGLRGVVSGIYGGRRRRAEPGSLTPLRASEVVSLRSFLGVVSMLVLIGGSLGVGAVGPVAAAEAGVADTGNRDVPLQADRAFSDIADAGGHRGNVETLAEMGILEGTECGADLFCPTVPIERWVMAVWLVRVVDRAEPPVVEYSRFADVETGVWWLPFVERLAEAGITLGCATEPARFCPTEPVTRQEMASFLVRAFRLEPVEGNRFADVAAGRSHAADINALSAAGVTAGCSTEPVLYCPLRDTTRAEMATFLARALGVDAEPPSEEAVTPAIVGDYTAVAAGWAHTCALRFDGTVTCWGANWWGQADPPPGQFLSVSAGGGHSCGIRTDHTLACWGDNRDRQNDSPEGEFAAVAAGGAHSCAMRSTGEVTCWGGNDNGEAGPPPGQFTAIAAGNWHACGIDTDGLVICWGRNDLGQADPPPQRFTSISLGAWHSCGITAERTVTCWGAGWDGQTRPPERLFTEVQSGWEHSCGIDADGEIACWGYNGNGQANPPEGAFIRVSSGDKHSCGIRRDHTLACWGRETDGPSTPRQRNFAAVEAADTHACGLRTDGTVTCWGRSDGRLLQAPTGEFIKVVADSRHSCGIRTDNTLACWGANWAGQSDPPDGEYIAVANGFAHTCGVRTDNTVICWGRSDNGRTDAPQGQFASIAAGVRYSCGIRTDRTIACWGEDRFGLTDPPLGEFTTISAGPWHSCATDTTRSVACWGHSGSGRADPPRGTFDAIASGEDHSCGMRSDQTIVCWGNNDFGQAKPPAGTFAGVSAASTYSCGTRTNGTISCWGRPLGIPAPSDTEHLLLPQPAEAEETAEDARVEEATAQLTQPRQASLNMCRPPGTDFTTAGFPLPARAAPSVGTIRVAVLFVDFPNAQAAHSTQREAELGLPYMEEYLEAASYHQLDVELVPLHRWLRAEHDYDHYLIPSVALGNPQLGPAIDKEAARLADPEFDFTGMDAFMVVMPSTHFGGGSASGRVTTGEETIWNTFRVSNHPLSEPREPTRWGPTGAHELAHSLGLADLYPYSQDPFQAPQATEGQTWAYATFGLMGLRVFFPISENDPRLSFRVLWPDGSRSINYTQALKEGEMLAWSRWQLGWLTPAQVHCLTDPETETTVTIGPTALPGGEAAMAAIPVSNTQVIVIESRRKLGYDTGLEYRWPSGGQATLPALAGEGVLVYTVNAALDSGELPITIAGDPGTGVVPAYPLLTEGQSVTIGGYTIKVQSASLNTDTITITKNAGS